MILTIVLRKTVVDVAQAETQTNLVRQRLEGFPDVTITAAVTESIEEPT